MWFSAIAAQSLCGQQQQQQQQQGCTMLRSVQCF
jgi:hypothetical protein